MMPSTHHAHAHLASRSAPTQRPAKEGADCHGAVKAAGAADLRLVPACWQILVVDEQPAVHQFTRLSLAGAQVLDRPLQLLHALSAAEARPLLRDNPGIALLLLDAGLSPESDTMALVCFVRDGLGQRALRIVPRLRPAWPGPDGDYRSAHDVQAPVDARLTASRLFEVVAGALKTYRDLRALHRSRALAAEAPAWAGPLARVRNLREFAGQALGLLAELPFFKAAAFVDVSLPEGALAGPATSSAECSQQVVPAFVVTLGLWQARPELDLPATLLAHARVLPHLLVSDGEWYACCLRGPAQRRAVLVLRAQQPLASPGYRAVEALGRELAAVFRRACLSPDPAEQAAMADRPGASEASP